MKIGGTNGVNGAQPIYPKVAGGGQPKAPDGLPQGDRVEISDAARLSEAILRLPEVRGDVVARAREMIASGQMDTPERMDAALSRMLDELIGPADMP